MRPETYFYSFYFFFEGTNPPPAPAHARESKETQWDVHFFTIVHVIYYIRTHSNRDSRKKNAISTTHSAINKLTHKILSHIIYTPHTYTSNKKRNLLTIESQLKCQILAGRRGRTSFFFIILIIVRSHHIARTHVRGRKMLNTE